MGSCWHFSGLCDPPDLCLQNSRNYRSELPHLVQLTFLAVMAIHKPMKIKKAKAKKEQEHFLKVWIPISQHFYKNNSKQWKQVLITSIVSRRLTFSFPRPWKPQAQLQLCDVSFKVIPEKQLHRLSMHVSMCLCIYLSVHHLSTSLPT
jgi:hypothetical protein